MEEVHARYYGEPQSFSSINPGIRWSYRPGGVNLHVQEGDAGLQNRTFFSMQRLRPGYATMGGQLAEMLSRDPAPPVVDGNTLKLASSIPPNGNEMRVVAVVQDEDPVDVKTELPNYAQIDAWLQARDQALKDNKNPATFTNVNVGGVTMPMDVGSFMNTTPAPKE